MKRRLALLLTALFLMVLCVSCGGGGSAAPPEAIAAPMDAGAEVPRGEGGNSSYSEVGSQIYRREDAKLIRRAQLHLQTTEFEQAAAALDRLTEQCGGYYETAEARAGDYYSSGANRHASYTVRVPQEQYGAFLSAVGEVGHTVSRTESSEDVGEVYYDTQLRLRTQQTKQERLLSLMEKAEKMEDIIALEEALTEVQYQIEQYTSTLNAYDALVDYATIEVSLEEVARLTETTGQALPLSTRIGRAFSQGMENFGTSMGNLAVWLAYHMVGVMLFLLAAVAAALLRRRLGRKNDKPTPSDQDKG